MKTQTATKSEQAQPVRRCEREKWPPVSETITYAALQPHVRSAQRTSMGADCSWMPPLYQQLDWPERGWKGIRFRSVRDVFWFLRHQGIVVEGHAKMLLTQKEHTRALPWYLRLIGAQAIA